MSRPTRPRISRTKRTVNALIGICALGALLALWSVYSSGRDLKLAIGPAGAAQRAFFIDAASRPDASTFFKSLTVSQRRTMVENIGRYDDPALAKLCDICLSDFDAQDRHILAEDLTRIAHRDPAAVAAQLSGAGSFQTIAIDQALRSVGPESLAYVAKEIDVVDARTNALEFLIADGEPSTAVLIPKLEDPDRDVRIAVAATLGRIRSKAAVPDLIAKWKGATGDERFAYLSALASIASPDLRVLLSDELAHGDENADQKAQIELGLGQIGGADVIRLLWQYAQSPDQRLSRPAIEGLRRCGDASLLDDYRDQSSYLAVAGGIHSTKADRIIALALRDRKTWMAAAQFAGGRPTLVTPLYRTLESASGDVYGGFCLAAIRALAQSSSGREMLTKLMTRPDLAGFILRESKLARHGPQA